MPVTDEIKSMKLQNVPDVIDVTSHKKRPLSTRDALNQSSNTRYIWISSKKLNREL